VADRNFNVLQKMYYSIFKPILFFNAIKDENFSSTFLYLIFIQFVGSLMYVYLLLTILQRYVDKGIYLLGDVFVLFISYGLFALSFLAISGFYHVYVKSIGGVSNYNDTFKALVYGFMPTLFAGNTIFTYMFFAESLPAIFGIILFIFLLISMIGSYYGIYLVIKAVSFFHKIPAVNYPLWFITFLAWFFVITSVSLFSLSWFLGSSMFAAAVVGNPEVMIRITDSLLHNATKV